MSSNETAEPDEEGAAPDDDGAAPVDGAAAAVELELEMTPAEENTAVLDKTAPTPVEVEMETAPAAVSSTPQQ